MKSALGNALGGIAVGLIFGFVLANGYARTEIERRRLTFNAQTTTKQDSVSAVQDNEKDQNSKLTLEELRLAIAHADKQPNNAKIQKEMGMALFRYASLEQNTELLFDAVRLMERAEVSGENLDTDFFKILGSANFILARSNKPENMLKALSAYQKAVRLNPKDLDLQVDLGMTYSFLQPPDLQSAVKVFSQNLKYNPNHERSLESLVRVLLEVRDDQNAEKNLEKLRHVNPSNSALNDLQTQLAQIRLSP